MRDKIIYLVTFLLCGLTQNDGKPEFCPANFSNWQDKKKTVYRINLISLLKKFNKTGS